MRKTTKKKLPPILIAVLAVIFLGGMWMAPILLALVQCIRTTGEQIYLTFPVLCYAIVGAAIIGGILLALRQRLREIDKGEEEDAAQY